MASCWRRCSNGCRCDRCVVGLVSAICLQLQVGLSKRMIAALWQLPTVEVHDTGERTGAGQAREGGA